MVGTSKEEAVGLGNKSLRQNLNHCAAPNKRAATGGGLQRALDVSKDTIVSRGAQICGQLPSAPAHEPRVVGGSRSGCLNVDGWTALGASSGHHLAHRPEVPMKAAPPLIGLIEIIGGTLCIAGSVVPKPADPGTLLVSIPLLNVLAGALTVMAGLLLLLKERTGVVPSLGVQLAQVVNFSLGWRYVFLAGPKVTWVLASVGTLMDVGVGGNFLLTPTPSDGTLNALGYGASVYFGLMPHPLATSHWTIGVNLLAGYSVYRLWLALGCWKICRHDRSGPNDHGLASIEWTPG